MAYFGKEFTLASQENFAEFVDTWPIPQDFKDKIVNTKGVMKITKDGDKYHFFATSLTKGGIRETIFTPGVEFEEEPKEGLKLKNVVTVDGDTFTHVMKGPAGQEVVFKRDFSENEVVVTITGSAFNGVAKRIYKA